MEKVLPPRNWKQNPSASFYGIESYVDANGVRKAAKAAIEAAKTQDKHQVKVRLRPNGKFDVLVFDRVGQ